METESGESVSNRKIKNLLRDIIAAENKAKPFSDDALSGELKKKGYNVARRTVTKYREQLDLPVARLRREI
jgi:RNA polymerase sigma-54 factor